MALKGTKDEARVRLLLTIWEMSSTGTKFKKSEITKKVVRKRSKSSDQPSEKSVDYKEFFDELVSKNAIAISGSEVTLSTDKLSSLLGNALKNSDFEFGAQIGKGKANALLRLIRSMNTGASSSENGKAAIASYEEFKSEALATFEDLNKTYNYGGLVPIWHLRDSVGTRLERTQFNDWVMKMQAEQLFYLQTGEAIGATEDQKRNSIESEIRGLMFYISQPS